MRGSQAQAPPKRYRFHRETPGSVLVEMLSDDHFEHRLIAEAALRSRLAQSFNEVFMVLLGNGDGNFQAPQFFAAGRYPRFVAVGDFNGDGMPDLAVANRGSADVSVLINNTSH